jgi:hypothetical protein
MLADRPAAVAALTRIFLDEIERLRGAVSFLHRFGSALNHHVHLHTCVTDGVFVPAAAEAAGDAPPALLLARPINQADLAALTERVRRSVIRWFRLARLLDAAEAPASLPRRLCGQPQAHAADARYKPAVWLASGGEPLVAGMRPKQST